jgi:integrase
LDAARRLRAALVHGRLGWADEVGKVRSVPLVDQAGQALDELSRRERWASDEDRVFVNDVGNHIEDSVLRRRFYQALDRAGLPHIRFHDLRDTFGTIAVQAFPLTDVKAFMGHADIQTTMVNIQHVPQHDAADRLTALLDQRNPGARGCAGARRGRPRDARNPCYTGASPCRRRDSNPRHADYDSAALTS